MTYHKRKTEPNPTQPGCSADERLLHTASRGRVPEYGNETYSFRAADEKPAGTRGLSDLRSNHRSGPGPLSPYVSLRASSDVLCVLGPLSYLFAPSRDHQVHEFL